LNPLQKALIAKESSTMWGLPFIQEFFQEIQK